MLIIGCFQYVYTNNGINQMFPKDAIKRMIQRMVPKDGVNRMFSICIYEQWYSLNISKGWFQIIMPKDGIKRMLLKGCC